MEGHESVTGLNSGTAFLVASFAEASNEKTRNLLARPLPIEQRPGLLLNGSFPPRLISGSLINAQVVAVHPLKHFTSVQLTAPRLPCLLSLSRASDHRRRT